MPESTNKGPRPGVLATDPAIQEDITFSGSIERIIFKNDENGYAILRVVPDKKEAGRRGIPLSGLTCVGTLLNPQAGQNLSFTGRFVQNARYGRQFQFACANEQVPASEAGLIAYLSSKLIKGMGPDLAERVVKTFGQDTIRVLDEEPEKLASVRGIGKKNLATIVESWRENRSLSDLMQFLQPHGISAAYGVRIYREYGTQSVQKVRENPYRLAMDKRRIGFLSADAMAEKLGVPRDSPLRMQGAVLYILQKASENGDVFLPRTELVARIEKELNVPAAGVLEAIDALVLDNRIVVDAIPLQPHESGGRGEDRAVYLATYYRCEDKTAYYLERLCQMPGNVTFRNVDKQVQDALQKQEHNLAKAQIEAVRMAAKSKVMVLTGGPGTGKTTIIKAIITLFQAVTKRIFLAAPTGRAAKRMAEATGLDAKTLHRLLEYNPGDNTFRRNEEEPLACDLLIVAEASRMDILIFYYLMKAVPTGCVVILVGDVFQLPSVGPGSVLADIIASGKVPVCELNEIFRQARTSEIVTNAHRINNGIVPDLVSPWERDTDFYFLEVPTMEDGLDVLVRLVCREIPERFGLNPLKDIQLITPMHKGAVGTVCMNSELQKTLNPGGLAMGKGGRAPRALPEVRRGDTIYRRGDKVMQIRNNYDKDVFNGDVGTILDIDPDRKVVQVVFDDRMVEYETSEMEELVLAYAISIHKSQGSEYPAVVIPLFMQHFIMLQRNLVYTAVTRGKKLVVLVGEKRALERAVANADVKRRYTRLTFRLREYVSNLYV